MATYSKQFLSARSGGGAVFLGSSGTPVTVHTTGTSSTIIDEVWLYLVNNDVTAGVVTVTINTDDTYINLPAESGMILAVAGLPICGTGSAGRDVTCTDNLNSGQIFAYGYVNRITP